MTAATEYVGVEGTGTFNQSGGTDTVTSEILLGFLPGSTGKYNLTGGTLILKSLARGEGTATFALGSGTLQASDTFTTAVPMTLTASGSSAKINTAGFPVTISSAISGAGGFTKIGANSLTISAANTYRGSTTVSEGNLNVTNTTGSATGTGAVTVLPGVTLSGDRHHYRVCHDEYGISSPGNGPGILTLNQAYLSNTSTFSVEVNGLTAGSEYDQLKTTGSIVLGGSLQLAFGAFTPTDGEMLFIINNTSTGNTDHTFQFTDNAKIGTFNGFDWYITYNANNTASPTLDGGNDVAIYAVFVP